MFKRYQLKNYDFKLVLLLLMISIAVRMNHSSRDRCSELLSEWES